MSDRDESAHQPQQHQHIGEIDPRQGPYPYKTCVWIDCAAANWTAVEAALPWPVVQIVEIAQDRFRLDTGWMDDCVLTRADMQLLGQLRTEQLLETWRAETHSMHP